MHPRLNTTGPDAHRVIKETTKGRPSFSGLTVLKETGSECLTGVIFVSGLVVSFLQHSNEPSGSVRDEDWLDQLVGYDFVPRWMFDSYLLRIRLGLLNVAP
jgi:hypothetical protein